ncbi:MAG: tRNA (adenosine(37)-N6)-threonylcarbamoyltransferase complex dimerization subunit type 1 TsaB, partial [Alphaproteobacteria bacterium]|nr:tRNA (adenosine(37)-N6)-threonylcarbamoyltransferase complex dimerization subunit type 1 TsaB [Alphaproteobacteria bacterium]
MSKFHYILALDSATAGCSACVLDMRADKAFSHSLPMARGQAEHLVPMIDGAMKDAGIDYKDLGALIVTTGPGAFTGLRIGLSAAKSLAMVLRIPALGVTTLQILALQYARLHKPDRALTVLVETKRTDFYMQRFSSQGSALSAPSSVTGVMLAGDIAHAHDMFVGDGAERFRDGLAGNLPLADFDFSVVLPDAEVMARLVAEDFAGLTPDISPLYLRPPDVTLPGSPPP